MIPSILETYPAQKLSLQSQTCYILKDDIETGGGPLLFYMVASYVFFQRINFLFYIFISLKDIKDEFLKIHQKILF